MGMLLPTAYGGKSKSRSCWNDDLIFSWLSVRSTPRAWQRCCGVDPVEHAFQLPERADRIRHYGDKIGVETQLLQAMLVVLLKFYLDDGTSCSRLQQRGRQLFTSRAYYDRLFGNVNNCVGVVTERTAVIRSTCRQ